MSAFSLTPLARLDVFEIWAYIAVDSDEAADRVEQAIYDACEFLAGSPQSGHTRTDLTRHPLRFWNLTRYPNYMLVFRPNTVPLEIIAVVQGNRNLPRLLNQRRQ
jgi:plasmid stabilization system protein ParE